MQTVEIPYSPNPKQMEFHKSSAKYRLFLGAWRSGKTFSGCKEALKQSMLYPNNRGLIGRKNFTDLRDTTMRTFFEVCPPELIKNYNKTEHHLILINNSEIFFRELKDRSGLGSFELGWFYIDEAEQVQEGIFTYLKGRINAPTTKRQCGWLTSNPPNRDHWLFKAFESGIANHFSIHADTYQNKKHLSDSYIKELEQLPESWRKKYLLGEYGFTPDGKAFYDGFKDSLHKRTLTYIKGKKIYRGIDFGFHHPAVCYAQIDTNDRFMILKELMGSDITIDKFADKMLFFENIHFPEARFETYYDPAGEQVSDKSEQTSVQILADKGITGRCKVSTYRERKELIERKLSLLINGIPALTVDESCPIITDGFLGGYHYPEPKEGKIVKEEPERDGYYEHLMNALEYIVVNVFTVSQNTEESEYESYEERFGKLG
jgi:PBSX family phage terminase large subunit